NELDEAELCGRKAIELEPALADGHVNLGMLFAQVGRWAEAQVCYEKALELTPDNVQLHCNLALVLKASGQFDESERFFVEALRRNPRDGQIYQELSRMRQFTPDDLTRCCALEAVLMDRTLPDSDRSGLHFALGKMYEDIGEFNLAFQHYRQANEL